MPVASSLPFVVVGAGQAGVQAAFTLRRLAPHDDIILLHDESLTPYQRPPLSKGFLLGKVAPDSFLLKPKAAYLDSKIRLTPHRALALEDNGARLRLDNGDAPEARAVILATGARPIKPDVPGVEHALVLRSFNDAVALRKRLTPNSRAVIVGGGYIGLEAASAALALGAAPLVMERDSRVLSRVAGEELADFITLQHRRRGVEILLNRSLQSVAPAPNNRFDVLDSGGETHRADVVILGVGVSPDVSLARDAGILVDNGVVVDEQARTSHPRVLACGDAASFPSRRYNRRLRLESVPNALEHAAYAAAVAADKNPPPYDPTPWFWSDQHDLKLQSAGLCLPRRRAVVRAQPDNPLEPPWCVFYLDPDDGRLLGADAVNDSASFMAARRLIDADAKPDPAALADASVPMRDVLRQAVPKA